MRRPEEALHRACCQILAVYQQRGLLAFAHPANGGWRTKGEAGVLKAMGLVAGVPDLLIWLPDGRSFQCELKAGSKPLTGPQIRWHDTMVALGHAVHVCRSIDDLEAVLRSHDVPAVGQLAPNVHARAPRSALDASEGAAGRVFGPRPRSSHSTRLP